MSGYEIATVPLGRGAVGISPMPGASGDYTPDLETLIAWRPDLVLSMTEPGELRGPLPGDLARAGVAWLAFPVADMNAPTAQPAQNWAAVSTRAHGVLAAGGRLLVHCFGGCGRSGMAVLRLMVETGEAPDAALARLRRARPCAVETESQRAWATR